MPGLRMQFCGDFKVLRRIMRTCAVGKWQKEPNGVRQFRSTDGAVMHWSTTKCTLWIQGPEEPRAALEEKLLTISGWPLGEGLTVKAASEPETHRLRRGKHPKRT